jgi:uncharacterized protein YutE (UPF0331/DUF86 family)
MDINDVIIRKLETLDITLGELYSLGKVTIDQLENDWRTRRAVERNLQVLVEIVIDICQRFLSISGQTPGTTGSEAIQRCIDFGVLSDFEAYRSMAQFRNYFVHRYERIDVEILVGMINRHLGDFDRFHPIRFRNLYVSKE